MGAVAASIGALANESLDLLCSTSKLLPIKLELICLAAVFTSTYRMTGINATVDDVAASSSACWKILVLALVHPSWNAVRRIAIAISQTQLNKIKLYN